MRKSKLMKALLVFGMSAITATSIVGFAACDSGNGDGGEGSGSGTGGHQHTYDTNWSGDSTHHWYEATCGDTDEKGSYGEHVNANGDAWCDVCNRELQHTFATEWKNDANGHWHEATCDHTTEKDSEAPHVDDGTATGSTANDNTCDVCGYIGSTTTGYDDLLAKVTGSTTKVVGDTFFVAKELPLFSNWGTAGLYASHNNETNKVTVANGKANLITPKTTPATNLYIDFGNVNGTVVEGYFVISDVYGANGYTAVQFTTSDGNSDSELFGLRTNKGNVYKYRLNGGSDVAGDSECTATWAAGGQIYFKYDTTTNKITVTINGQKFVTDLQLTGSTLKGVKFSSGSGNDDTFSVDDILVVKTPVDVSTYKTALTAMAAAEKAKVHANITVDDATIKSTFEGALDAATTNAECDTAYNTYYTALVDLYNDAAANKLNSDYPVGSYTKEENKPAYDAAIAAWQSAVTDTMDKVTAAYTTADKALQGIHTDAYYNKQDVTVTVVNGKTEANTLTVKEGDIITKAQLDALVDLADNQKVSGYYSDVDCTAGNEVNLPLTASVAVSIYAKIETKTINTVNLDITKVPSSAPTEETQIDTSIFYITTKVKSENGNKMAVVDGTATYAKQVSLTGGAASATANSIKFTVTGATTVTVVAGQKADKNVTLAVLDSEGNKVNVSNLKINNVDATGFDTLPKATANTVMPNTYTFTLAAGTYYLGGSGGGAYIYALSLGIEV